MLVGKFKVKVKRVCPSQSLSACGPLQVSLANVKRYAFPWHGVYHPDNLAPAMGWQGSGHGADRFSGWRNPFADISEHMIVEAYTEALPAEASMLQWAMPQYGECMLPCKEQLAFLMHLSIYFDLWARLISTVSCVPSRSPHTMSWSSC